MASRARVLFFAVIVRLPKGKKSHSSGRHRSLAYPLFEMLKRVRELCGRALSPHQISPNLRRLIQQPAIPAEMFARDPDSTLLAVKEVQGVEMRQNDITQVGAQQWRRRNSVFQMDVDSAEDPWRTMTRAPNHYSVRAREIKYLARFFRRSDIAVHEYRNLDARFDSTDGVVLGRAFIKIRARAAVHRERGDAALLRDACNGRAVPVLAVPAGTYLEGHGHVDRVHHRLQNARHQRLV